jgi:glycosyltransferase involved in cell wall biosynthesis
MRISIIVPCRNEERFIGPCLDSILATHYPPHDMEVLVVDGRSDDRTREILDRYAEKSTAVVVLDNPERIVSTALNRGIRAATGEVIVRLDAHAVYPAEYVPRLVSALLETGADNVGGRMVTMPAGPGPVHKAIALALAHRLAVGNAYFRIGSTRRRWVDTVPFGCYRRDVFARFGMFDEDLVRNQDDEFNHRIIRNGGRVLLLPDVVSCYYARDSLAKLSRMYYQYGYFKPVAARKLGRVMTVRQVVPSLWLLSLLVLTVLGFAWPAAHVLWLVIMALYVVAIGAAGIAAMPAHGVRCGLALAVAFPVMHVSYGLGFMLGMWDLLFKHGGRIRDPAAVPLTR